MLSNHQIGAPKIEPFFTSEPDITLAGLNKNMGFGMEELIETNPVFSRKSNIDINNTLSSHEIWGTITHLETILSENQPSPIEFKMVPLKVVKKVHTPGEYANHLGVVVKPLFPLDRPYGTSIPLGYGEPLKQVDLYGVSIDPSYYKKLYRLMNLTWDIISTDKIPLEKNINNFSNQIGILYPFLEGRFNCLIDLIQSNPKFHKKNPEEANTMMTAWSQMGPQPLFEDMYRYLKNQ